MNRVTEAYPLNWPLGWKRAAVSIDSRFGSYNKKPTIAAATNKLLEELRLFGCDNVIISSDLKLRLDGLPYSSQRTPEDSGVAVYFTYKKEQRVIACDTYSNIGCNIWGISKTIEALRGINRWGCSEILNKAFDGFKALPEHAGPSVGKRDWWVVMGYYKVDQVSSHGAFGIKNVYKMLVKELHPDNPHTGDRKKFDELQIAYKEGLEYLK